MSSSRCLSPALGLTQSSIQWKLGAPFPGVKQLGLEAEHSLLSSAEIKNAWSYSCTPTYLPSWHVLYLVFLFIRHCRYLCCNSVHCLKSLIFPLLKICGLNKFSWAVYIYYEVNGIFRSLIYIGWCRGQIFS